MSSVTPIAARRAAASQAADPVAGRLRAPALRAGAEAQSRQPAAHH